MQYDEAAATLSACGRYRYRLTRTWDHDRPAACFVMLNPSTADATRNDPTVRRVIGFARAWGCGGVVVVNLFALRSAAPAALRAAADPVGPDNDYHLRLALWEGWPRVVAAWGAHPFARPRAAAVAAQAAEAGLELACLGRTRGGHPRHPLRLSGRTALVPYQFAPLN